MRTTHGELINGLVEVLKTKRDKNRATEFKRLITELKDNCETEISTKFLRGLLDGYSFRQKTKKVNYLMRRAGLKTERRLRYYRTLAIQKYTAEIKEFIAVPLESITKDNLINNGEIEQYKRITEPYGLTEEEQLQLKEIEQVREETGGLICLYPSGLIQNEEKNRTRRAVYNKNLGIARLKNSRKQEIGREFLGCFSEVVFIVRV